MNRAKNLLKEEYLTIRKRWEYWFDRSEGEYDEEVDTLERFWYNVLQQIILLISKLERTKPRAVGKYRANKI